LEKEMKPFGEWLIDQLAERDMKPADLIPYGMSSAVSSNIINGKRQPAVESCKIIAKALNIPLEEVYRAAEILPPKPDIDPISEKIMNLLLDLQREDKEDILEYARLRHKLATERNNLAPNRKRIAHGTAST
jgi:hypothetical protein